jgi:hypothetical protein
MIHFGFKSHYKNLKMQIKQMHFGIKINTFKGFPNNTCDFYSVSAGCNWKFCSRLFCGAVENSDDQSFIQSK